MPVAKAIQNFHKRLQAWTIQMTDFPIPYNCSDRNLAPRHLFICQSLFSWCILIKFLRVKLSARMITTGTKSAKSHDSWTNTEKNMCCWQYCWQHCFKNFGLKILKRSAQVQYNHNTTAIQAFFLVLQYCCIALVRTAAIQQNFCVILL